MHFRYSAALLLAVVEVVIDQAEHMIDSHTDGSEKLEKRVVPAEYRWYLDWHYLESVVGIAAACIEDSVVWEVVVYCDMREVGKDLG